MWQLPRSFNLFLLLVFLPSPSLHFCRPSAFTTRAHRGTISKAVTSLNMLRPEIKKASTSSTSWMGVRFMGSTSGTQKWLRRRGVWWARIWRLNGAQTLGATSGSHHLDFGVEYARAVDHCLSSSVFSLRCRGNVSNTWFVFWMSCWYGPTSAKWSDSQICWVYFRILSGFGNLRGHLKRSLEGNDEASVCHIQSRPDGNTPPWRTEMTNIKVQIPKILM